MDLQPVQSGMLTAIGYDKDTSTLHVQFPKGDIYRYPGFPQELWEQFQAAESKGKFFAASIRGKFSGTKVTPVVEEASAS